MNRMEKTQDLFMNGGLNCAQAILTVYGEAHGIDPDTARTLGRPLGSGIGVSGQMCGFLTGAVQVLVHAFTHTDERQALIDTHARVLGLIKTFKEKHGAVTCNELLGVQRSTVEGEKRVKEEGLVAKKCPAFCRDTAEILETLLMERFSRPDRAGLE